jgi:hypothetical protein
VAAGMESIRIDLSVPCDVCNKLGLDGTPRASTFHSPYFQPLRASAESGKCFVCKVIHKAILSHGILAPHNDLLYIQAKPGRSIFIRWVEMSGVSLNLEVFRKIQHPCKMNGPRSWCPPARFEGNVT